MIVGKLVGVPILLLVLGLERDGGGAGLGLVAAERDPLLLEALLVLEVVLHVGQHHVPRRDVHLGGRVGGRLLTSRVAEI